MSLIETALKKIQQNAGRQEATGALRPPQRRVKSANNPLPVDPKAVRRYARASIDANTMEKNRVLPQVQDTSALRAYKIMRTRLLQRMTPNNWNSLAITGTESGQGKTLTAINLAIALAQDPNTFVFLVDLDLQRPQIANYLGMSFERGLGDYLVGEAELDQIIYDTSIERLSIIPNGRSFEHSSEYLSTPRLLDLVNALGNESPTRIVIYDLPPLLLSDDVLTFAPHADGVLLVVTEGTTARGSLERSKELLAEMNLVGVVLNRSSERNDSPYY